jgi:hypothetical protein
VNKLIGGWRLRSWRISYSDGRAPTFPYGQDAGGVICYTPDGWMNASIYRAGRKPLSTENVRAAPEGERLAAFDSFFNYGGRYEIKGDHVVHSVTHALNPNFVGTDQVRKMTFAADGTLTLSATDMLPGTQVERLHELVWMKS